MPETRTASAATTYPTGFLPHREQNRPTAIVGLPGLLASGDLLEEPISSGKMRDDKRLFHVFGLLLTC